jgi:hypothetical protein
MLRFTNGLSVSFTARRLSELDERSARRFRNRVGLVVAQTSRATHVSVEFPADGERRPERLEKVPVEYLELVVPVYASPPAASPPPFPACPGQ